MALADTGIHAVRAAFGEETVTFASAVVAGEPVAYSAGSSGWVPADASDTTLPCRAIALQDCEAGKEGEVAFVAVIDGFTGGTPGAVLYLSDTAGEYAASHGTATQVLGWMITATQALIMPNYAIA